MDNRVVLYFEDTDEFAEILDTHLNVALSGFASVERFFATEESTEKMYDARLQDEILKRKDSGSRIVFILSDADLATTQSFLGLSEANVSKVANKLGIPAAFYSSNLTEMQFVKADQAGDGRLLLDRSDPSKMAGEVARFVHGFCFVEETLKEITSLAKSQRPADTATFLAMLMGRPEIKNRVKLYLSGDQRVGAELLSSPDHAISRQTAIFGTLICDSILKYPGITVNNVAAASYLNIDVKDFERPEVQSLFADALYRGPFSSSNHLLWWRDILDDLLLDADVDDGRQYTRIRAGIEVGPCLCSESGNEPAGYYCMITKQPVSEECSQGGISWFPPGADLAKIASSKYDELAPWLAI